MSSQSSASTQHLWEVCYTPWEVGVWSLENMCSSLRGNQWRQTGEEGPGWLRGGIEVVNLLDWGGVRCQYLTLKSSEHPSYSSTLSAHYLQRRTLGKIYPLASCVASSALLQFALPLESGAFTSCTRRPSFSISDAYMFLHGRLPHLLAVVCKCLQ